MKIKEIQIKNFRSIKNERVVFNHDCLILLGKNEAGKSNILKAIACVFGEYVVSNKDKRKRIENEKIESNDYYVRAVLSLEKNDFELIEDTFNDTYKGIENIKFKKGISLSTYIRKVFYNLIIKIQIKDNSSISYTYWNPVAGYELKDQIRLNGNEISITQGNITKLEDLLFEILKENYENDAFNCHYWSYSDDYLLPGSVDINTFVNKPSNYKGLENIFHLCGREKIKEEFEASKSEDGDYFNLLEQVSIEVTKTFRKIWKDFSTTSIQLLPNGNEMSIKVVNKAKYNFEDRSDGFKKFISILLMLSTQSRSNKISEKDIILIDEPDQSLYPTSAKFLKDELIEISKKSKVVFSTHSQYMIDSNCLDRHLVVEKKDDISTIKIEDKNAPYTDDELLRRAIGSSIFECLQPINVIFEGWLDKELFNKYLSFNKKTNDFKNIGITYLWGISGVEQFVSLLILANKKFVVVADSDEVSSNKRTDFQKNYPQFKDNWIGYSDLKGNFTTMEDFFNQDYILSKIVEENPDYKYDDKKNAITNIDRAVQKDKERKQKIKNSLINDLKNANISKDYDLLVELIKEKIK